MKHRDCVLALVTLPCAGVAPILAHAQATHAATQATADDTLQEVLVTAERRTADPEKLALPVCVIDGEALGRRAESAIAQVLEDVPGVVLQGLTSFVVDGLTCANRRTGCLRGRRGYPVLSRRAPQLIPPGRSSRS